jgi:hypothetical protein
MVMVGVVVMRCSQLGDVTRALDTFLPTKDKATFAGGSFLNILVMVEAVGVELFHSLLNL